MLGELMTNTPLPAVSRTANLQPGWLAGAKTRASERRPHSDVSLRLTGHGSFEDWVRRDVPVENPAKKQH
jgi:hypothetical protein